jgi:peroxiredoxin Q/BCP
MRLSPGDTAPAFTALDADETPHSLKEFKGKNLVIYFYPAALTPGCTKQACDFRDNLTVLAGADYEVVGISPDKPAKLAKFRETHDLPFLLLSDPDKEILEAYGAWGEKTMYGKKVTGVIRSTIVVDPKGKVAHAWYNVKATGHVAKLLRDLDLAAA